MLCILCDENPPIDHSHVIPSFVFRRMKAGSPLPYMKHSSNPRKNEQDGWKLPYLCSVCETRFSRWEGAFASSVYDPFINNGITTFGLTDSIAMFAASLHFRHLKLWRDKNPDQNHDDNQRIYGILMSICSGDVYDPTEIYSYIHFLNPVTSTETFPRGINTYFFEATDGEFVDWNIPPLKIWVSYVKLPYVAFILTDYDLRTLPGGDQKGFERNLLTNSGQIDASVSNPGLLFFVQERMIQTANEIQESYKSMSPEKVTRMEEKIKNTPDFTNTRAHQSYLLDQALVENPTE